MVPIKFYIGDDLCEPLVLPGKRYNGSSMGHGHGNFDSIDHPFFPEAH